MAQSYNHDDFDPADSAYSVFKRVQVRVNRVYFIFYSMQFATYFSPYVQVLPIHVAKIPGV